MSAKIIGLQPPSSNSTGMASAPSTENAPVVTDASKLRFYLEHVSFDVAVTASDEQSAEAGAGIKVWGARLGADGKVS